MAKFKPFDIKKLRSQIETGLKATFNNEYVPEVVIPEIEAFIRKEFEKTIKNWQGGSGAYAVDPSITSRVEPKVPELSIEVTQTRLGAELEVFVQSYIWNLLDQGRPDRVTKKREKFVGRAEQRTIPGTLDVSNDRYYTETVYVPANHKIEGFKARGWSTIIAKAVEKEFESRYPFIEVKFTVKDDL